ncbi:MAG: hypothetical protein K6357_03075 [Elusimicrobiota bacterium]
MKVLSFFFLLTASSFAVDIDYDGYKTYICDEIKKPFFRYIEENGEKYAVPNRSFSSNFKIPLIKTNKKRIFILGESIAQILLSPQSEYFSVENYEWFNLGMGAYDSQRIKNVLEESIVLKPDIVIILSGNNEFLNEGRCGKKILSGFINSISKDINHNYLENIRRHKKILKEMVEIASKNNIKLAFTTVPQNLLMPPKGVLPLNSELIKAINLISLKKYDIAFSLIEKIKGLDNNPFLDYYAGVVLYNTKNYSKAFERLNKAIREEIMIDRSDDIRNDMIKKTAMESGICIIDLDGYFKKISNNIIINPDYFADYVHWFKTLNPSIHRFIFNELEECRYIKHIDSREIDIKGYLTQNEIDSILLYTVAYMPTLKENDFFDERIIYMLDRFIKMNKKDWRYYLDRRKFNMKIRNSMWVKLEGDDELYDNFLIYLAEVYRRNKKNNIALSIIDLVDGFYSKKLLVKGLSLKESGKEKEFLDFCRDNYAYLHLYKNIMENYSSQCHLP